MAYYWLEAEDLKPPNERTPATPEQALLQQQTTMMLAEMRERRERARRR